MAFVSLLALGRKIIEKQFVEIQSHPPQFQIIVWKLRKTYFSCIDHNLLLEQAACAAFGLLVSFFILCGIETTYMIQFEIGCVGVMEWKVHILK